MAKPSIERMNEIEGQPPTSTWVVAVTDDRYEELVYDEPGPALILLVGLRSVVARLEQKLMRPTLMRNELRLPCCEVTMSAEGLRELPLAVLVVGVAPTYEDGRQHVIGLQGSLSDGPSQWSRRIREFAKRYPTRIASQTTRPSTEVVHKLCQLYLDECRRAVGVLDT